MVNREVVEEYIEEEEQGHRLAHLFLAPIGLYKLWNPEETKGFEEYIKFVVLKRVVYFKLIATNNFKPPLYYYKFIGFYSK